MNPFRRKNDPASMSQSVVLDTSGLIDGRIVEIAKAGFVPQHIVVPQFVIAELQFLADHGDSHKRERARYGLDVVRELQDLRHSEVEIAREKIQQVKEVDDKLVILAKQRSAMLYTTDFNLNKVAQIEGLIVLNVNELAHALRPNLLPGERVAIKLTQVGQDRTQGVGYLDDGTMVVVENASRLVGQQVQTICTRILQTQAGKMMFATLANAHQQPNKQQNAHKRDQQHKPQQRTHEDAQPSQKQQAAGSSKQKPQQSPHKVERSERAASGEQPRNRQTAAKSRQQKQPTSGEQQPQRQKPTSGQNQTKPKQPQQSKGRGGQQKRRVSPEDSLIATLSQMQD